MSVMAPESNMPSSTVLELLVGRVGQRAFAVSAGAVERVLRMVELGPSPVGSHHVAGLLNLHGAVVPVVDLRPVFGLPAGLPEPDQHLIVLARPHRFALWVDRVEEVRLAAPTADMDSQPATRPRDGAPVVVRLGSSVVPVLSAQALDPGLVFDLLTEPGW